LRIQNIYFGFMCENRRIKLVEIVLRRRGDEGE
jgi:hypothetical protein